MFSALVLFGIGFIIGYTFNNQAAWDYVKAKSVLLINKLWK